MRRPVPLAVSLTATLALAAGCTKDPGPPPPITGPPGVSHHTSEHETEPTPDPRRAAQQEAIQTLKDFNTASDQVGQAGYQDLNPVSVFLTGDFTMAYLDDLGWLRSQGAVQVGELTITNIKVVDHHAVEDPFYDDQITIEACVDNTDVDIVLPDGSSTVDPSGKGRFIATITMWHWKHEDMGTWSIAGYMTEGGRPC